MPFWKKTQTLTVRRDSRLVGRWDLDPTDAEAHAAYGNTTMVFGADGRLTYITHEEGKDQLMLLTWRTEGDTIVSNQPSHPREDRTSYRFIDERTLVLVLAGRQARYLRGGAPPSYLLSGSQ